MADDREGATAVVVYRAEDRWEGGLLPERLAGDLAGLVAAVRQQPAEGAALGLVNVADEFFVALRVAGGQVRLLLSDVTAAAAWDLARQVVEWLDGPLPADDDMAEVWPAGDLSLFADLGMDEMELGAVLSDLEDYASEMLDSIAARCGFDEAYHGALDAAVR